MTGHEPKEEKGRFENEKELKSDNQEKSETQEFSSLVKQTDDTQTCQIQMQKKQEDTETQSISLSRKLNDRDQELTKTVQMPLEKPSSLDATQTQPQISNEINSLEVTQTQSQPSEQKSSEKKKVAKVFAKRSPSDSLAKTGKVMITGTKSKKSFSVQVSHFYSGLRRDILEHLLYHKPLFGWVFILFLVVSLSFIFHPFERFELSVYDMMYRLKNNIPQSEKIVIAEINDHCKNLNTGTWPWSRKIHAVVVKNLVKVFNPALIGMDILFLGPSHDPKADFALKRTVKSGNVYLPFSFQFDEDELKKSKLSVIAVEKYDDFLKEAKGTGHVNYVPDIDGAIRRVPLLIFNDEKWVPHLAFQMILDYLGVSLSSLTINPGRYILFKDRKGQEYQIPVDENCQTIIAWPGKWVNTFRHISCVDIIQATAAENYEGHRFAINPQQYHGSIIFIGDTTTGTVDAEPTPFEKRCPLVNVLAALTNQVMHRVFIKPVPFGMQFLFSILIAFFISLIVLKYPPFKASILSLLSFILILLVGISLLTYFNIYLEIFKPLFTLSFSFLLIGTYSHIRFKDHVDLKLSFEQKLSMADAKLPQFRSNLKIGNYSNISELGRGGMAIVYKGTGKDGKCYAVKVINPECLAKDKLFKYRFKREIATMKRVIHPNVIRIYDSGSYQGVLYYAMELFPAGDLGDHLQELHSISDWNKIAIFFIQLLSGLMSIHKAGLIHRDIKPANIMMNDEQQIKIADFGLAKSVEEGQVLTTVGQVLGTPAYLAPELCTGEEPTFQADIYAMGIIFYEIVAGYRPFQECTSMIALMQAKLRAPISTIGKKRENLPDALTQVIDKMVSKDPNDRYKTCEDAIEDLKKFLASNN